MGATVFTKNRQRLTEHDAVVAFNAVLKPGRQEEVVVQRHFSVDGTLVKPGRATRASMRKDGKDDDDGDSAASRAATRRT